MLDARLGMSARGGEEQPNAQGEAPCCADLAQMLTQKEKLTAIKEQMPAAVAKALARISGGLYVVTAASGSARSAMIASWVSQASFEPLGLTIAVAKDRAIESLMQVGDRFALNVLGEGNYQATLKHFLTRFPAGADRFEGVPVSAAGLAEGPLWGCRMCGQRA